MNYLLVAAISGFVAVVMGAFGAHGLKPILSDGMLNAYQTGAHYHLIHSAVLLAVAVWIKQHAMKAVAVSAGLFLIGIVLFSGSLYVMAVTGIRALGMVTPIGGVFLLAGWAALAWAAYKAR